MTDHQNKNWKSYCSEPLELVENYQQAKADNFAGWCIHHRLEIQTDGTRVSRQELKDQNLYYGRPASELVFMRNCEHCSLHNIGNTYMKGRHHSEETRLKLSANNGHFWKGKHHSEETRQKLSQSLKGKNNWTKDLHWWNNGISNKRSRECPGEGWTRGRLLFK